MRESITVGFTISNDNKDGNVFDDYASINTYLSVIFDDLHLKGFHISTINVAQSFISGNTDIDKEAAV